MSAVRMQSACASFKDALRYSQRENGLLHAAHGSPDQPLRKHCVGKTQRLDEYAEHGVGKRFGNFQLFASGEGAARALLQIGHSSHGSESAEQQVAARNNSDQRQINQQVPGNVHLSAPRMNVENLAGRR